MAAKAKKAEVDDSEKIKVGKEFQYDENQWTGLDAELYGGNTPILEFEVGQTVGPITYNRSQQIETSQGTATSHTGQLGPNSVRLPISATFTKAVEEAQLQRGDVIAVRREADRAKARGKGAGNMMAIYAIKVIKRAKRPDDEAAE